jgi:hypothetical protein
MDTERQSRNQTRNPNIGTRNKFKIENPIKEMLLFRKLKLGAFEFISNFGFRASDLLHLV